MGTAVGIGIVIIVTLAWALVMRKCLRDVWGMYLRCPACGAVLRKELPFVMTAYCPKCQQRYDIESKKTTS